MYCSTDANITLNGTMPKDYFGTRILMEDVNNDTLEDPIVSANGKNLSGGRGDWTGHTIYFMGLQMVFKA